MRRSKAALAADLALARRASRGSRSAPDTARCAPPRASPRHAWRHSAGHLARLHASVYAVGFVERRSPPKRPRFGALEPAANRPYLARRAASRQPLDGVFAGAGERARNDGPATIACLGKSLSHDIRRAFRRRWAVTLVVPALGCALVGTARADGASQVLVQGAAPPAPTAAPHASESVAQSPEPVTAAPAAAQAPAQGAVAGHAVPTGATD